MIREQKSVVHKGSYNFFVRCFMFNIRHFLVPLILLVFSSMLLAGGPITKVGTAGALFLRIPVGAEAMAMGSAYTAIVNNADAAFWNPAALGFQKSKYSLSAHYSSWLLDLDHQAAAVAMKLGKGFTVGISEVLLKSPLMEVTTTAVQSGSGEFFSYQDLSVGLSIAKRFTDRFAAGITGKVVNQSVYTVSATGIAFDVGTWYWTGYRDLRLVMSMRNFGPDMRFGGTFLDTRKKGSVLIEEELFYGSYPLPLSFVVGLAGSVYSTNLLDIIVSLEGNYPNDYSQRVHAGAKVDFVKRFSLLFGYVMNYEQESFGLGFSIRLKNLVIQYGYRPMEVFEGVSSFSLSAGL